MNISNISTFSLYNRPYQHISKTYQELSDLTELMASEQKFDDFTTLSSNGDSHIIMNMNREIQKANTYLHNAILIELRTEVMFNAIENINNLAQNVINTLSSQTHIQDSFIMKSTAENKLKEIQNELNTISIGCYIFSGSKSDQIPVPDLSPNNAHKLFKAGYYQGDDILNSAKLSDSFELEYGITANNPAFTKLIEGCLYAIEASENRNMLPISKSLIQDSINELIKLQQKTGYYYSVASQYKKIHEETKAELQNTRNKIERDYKTGLIEVIGQFSEKKNILEAMHHTFNTLTSMNLVKHIK